jgi:HPt (histidine-containing phosphotransfer) domain-containing protein
LAHALKGSAGTSGAEKMQALAFELQQACEKNLVDDLGEIIYKLKTEFEKYQKDTAEFIS